MKLSSSNSTTKTLTIQSAETVTAVVGTTTSEMEFTGGTVFFGADAAVTDVTAAVDYLEAGLDADEAAGVLLGYFTPGSRSHR